LGSLEEARVIAIENGIDLDWNRPGGDFIPLTDDRLGGGPVIVFTGQMDYRPNVDAVSHFAEHSLPVVQKFWPDAQFAIVGRNPSRQVQQLAERPGVIVTGTVPDVRPWIAAATVVVAPLRIARGVQNKVLEAMAMGKAVVASSAAAEGIEAEAGRELVVADCEQVPVAILDLLGDADRAAAIGAAARRRMEARYRWEDRLAPLVKLVAGC
jgi:glycosyltransferase involved in cell wall biosynthesis